MSIIRISPLEIKDIDLLLKLRMEVLFTVFEDESKNLTEADWEEIRNQNRRYYESQLERNGHKACVAYLDGALAGCGGICLYDEMPSPDNRSGKCAYLMNIYVRDEYRRRGLARNICNYLIENAKEYGAEKIYLESSDMAVPFYESIGFKDMNGYMKLMAS